MNNDNGRTEQFPWENPPPPTNGQHVDGAALAAQLKSAPGRWARVRQYPNDAGGKSTAHSYTGHVRNGQARWARPAGSFEATVRVVGDARVVYVRYVGESASSTPRGAR
jgi:hypothetical protein